MSDQFFVSLDASSTTSSLKFRPKKKKKPSPFKPPPIPPHYHHIMQQHLLHQHHLAQQQHEHRQPLDLISNSSSIPSASHRQPQSLDHFDVNSIYASYNPYVTSQSVSSAHAGQLLNQQHLHHLSQSHIPPPPPISRRPRPPPPPNSHKHQQLQLPPQFLPLQVFKSNDDDISSDDQQPIRPPHHPPETSAAPSETVAEHQRPKCHHCASMIIDEECTEAEGGVYHIKCFACTSCRRPLGGLQYIMHPVSDGSDIREPYCTDCFDSQFGEYCEGCGNLIHVAKGAAITHEGRSWHANEYCFKCQNCHQSLLGLPFLPHSSGYIFCSVNCSKDAFNPRLRQSNNHRHQQQQQQCQQNNHNSDTGTGSATSTPSCISKNNDEEDHAIESLDCKRGSEIRDSGSIASQLTRIQDEATPPPLPSLSPSSGCSSSNSIQANSLNSSSKNDDHHHHLQDEQQLHHRPLLESCSLKQTPPPVFQTSSPLSGKVERDYSTTSNTASASVTPAAQGPQHALYASIPASTTALIGTVDGDDGDASSSKRGIVLYPVPQEEVVVPEDSASSSYYACIGSLFNQALVHPHPVPHQSVQIPVNPHSPPAAAADSPLLPNSQDQVADSRKMIAIHAQQNQNEGVVSHQIRDRNGGHQNTCVENAVPATQSPPSPVPSLPPKSPTICLLNGTSFEVPADGQVNPAFKTDEADSSESNNNKNDLIEELESIRIVDQSTSKTPKTVSFDETMKEKESAGRRLRARRRRRGKRKHHHSGRRRRDHHHHHHRNHRSSCRSKSKSDDDEEEEDEESDSDCCSCSSCYSSSSSDSSCSTCSSSSSSDEDDDGAGDLQWSSSNGNHGQDRVMPMSSKNGCSSSSIEAGRSARKQSRSSSGISQHPQQQFLTSSSASHATGSLTRPPLPLRPDIKRQPNTACLIQ